VPDLKEFWQIGQMVTDNDPVKSEYPENLTVTELPEFDPTTREVYQKLESAGKYLLRAIAVYLDLPENYFDDKVHNGNSILRTLHYFPIENPYTLPPDAVRAGAHEDINLITLLIGASADGLELLTRENEWFPVKAHGQDVVVNVGDMLQRLTNNKLKSTTHRVVNPPREEMKNSRYSVPFFLHPKSDMDLTCLETCIDAAHPKLYSDMTAGEYLDERLREIGLKK
jgi:isopenicillin N synthase-like dioxygenase